MGKILFITANPKPIEDSYCLSVGEEFIEAYKNQNPSDEIKRIDLYKDSPQLLDYDVFSVWKKLADKASSDISIEKEKIQKINEITKEFIEYDKYIFVYPVWNFNIPPMLKAYIDNILIAGKTFKYTSKGPIGLLENKKALIIQASGGTYTGTEMDFAYKYVKTILNFMNITEIESILIQGIAQFQDKADIIKQKAIDNAKMIAKSF